MDQNRNKWQPIFKRKIPLNEIYLWVEAYSKYMRKTIGWGFSNILFISKEGIEQSYRYLDDEILFRHFLKTKIAENHNFITINGEKINFYLKQWLKVCSDINNINLNKISNKKLKEIYKLFCTRQKYFYSVLQFPVYVERALVNIKNKKIKTQLKHIANIRNEADKVLYKIYNNEQKKLFKEISKRIKIEYKLSYYILEKEIIKLLGKKKINLNKKIIKDRYNFYVLLMKENKKRLFIKNKAIIIKNKEIGEKKINNIYKLKGKSIYVGKVKGKVKIIFSKNEFRKFKRGNILVTTMSSPWFMPVIKKSKAIITDEGGITCHAAIMAREFKKPCIIDTKIATKILTDGDLVEVDANSGIIKKIK